jgi:hypothetical protein
MAYKTWSVDQVGTWIQSVGFGTYSEQFLGEKILSRFYK